MKRTLVLLALVLSAGSTFAQTKQEFSPGWTYLNEPLNYQESSITWGVKALSENPPKSELEVKFALVGANPNKLYEVGIVVFCTTFPDTFGQFPVWGLSGSKACQTFVRQGVTKSLAYVDVGVVTTDLYGDGVFSVGVGPVPSGTYDVEFFVRDGAGCNLTGGGSTTCGVDFQSPGPTFGGATTIIVP
jgi:hypothetical protein